MTEPCIVLLDEVGARVNRSLLSQIADTIKRLNQERGFIFCIIEHDMEFIAKLCDPVYVTAEGELLTSGSVDDIRNNEAVIEAYLGSGPKSDRASSPQNAPSAVPKATSNVAPRRKKAS